MSRPQQSACTLALNKAQAMIKLTVQYGKLKVTLTVSVVVIAGILALWL